MLMMITTQIRVRSAAVKRPAEVTVLYAVAHVVVVPAGHVGDAGDVRLRFDGSVGCAG